MTKECPVCHTSFKKPYGMARSQFSKQVCCSNRCAGERRSKNTPPRVLPSKVCVNCGTTYFPNSKYSKTQWEASKRCTSGCTKRLPQKVCLVCELPFEVKPYRLKIAKTCSPSCSGKLRYKGTTPIQEEVRRLFARWRVSVFERDDYTCQECGVKGVTLNADHIVPFAKLFYENDWVTMGDVSNGRTLCVPCHRATPTYGKNYTGAL